MNKRIYRILSIDGGGIRGVYPSQVLDCIQSRLGIDVVDRFQMFAGTSTGSIVAAGIANGEKPSKIVSLYKEDGKKIFCHEIPSWYPRFLAQAFHSKYYNFELAKVLDREFGGLVLGEIAKPLILPATDIGNGGVHVFKSKFSDEFTRDPSVKVASAVLASCSAPAFFDPIKVGNYMLADGGIWANNPSLVAYTEAIHRLKINPENIRILSLGTGNSKISYGSKPGRSWGLMKGWKGKRFIEFLLSLQAQTTQNQLKLLTKPKQLLRINFDSDAELPLDDPTCVDDLISQADRDFSDATKKLKAFFDE